MQTHRPPTCSSISASARSIVCSSRSRANGAAASVGRAGSPSDEVPIFGRATLNTVDVSLRASLAITPRISLTSYNQLLHTTAHHTEFFELTRPETLVSIAPDDWYGTVDRGLSSLVSNTILRWEYLPGSFVFVAYTHRSVRSRSGQAIDWRFVDAFINLAQADTQHEDLLFVKLGYLFGL